MVNPSRGSANFWAQTDALLRKSWTYQKRNKKSNCGLISLPIFFCLLLYIGNKKFQILDDLANRQAQKHAPPDRVCNADEIGRDSAPCSIPKPQEFTPLLQIPFPNDRAVRNKFYGDLPEGSCKRTGLCPATLLVTGQNKSLGLDLAGHFFPSFPVPNSSDVFNGFAAPVLGSEVEPDETMFTDSAFNGRLPLYNLQHQCRSFNAVSISHLTGNMEEEKEIKCLQGLCLWRNSSGEINDELFEGYWTGNPEGKLNEIVAAYDFLNSSNNNWNVNIWYNSTNQDPKGTRILRVARSVNMVSNAYLKSLHGSDFKILLDFVKEMPKHPSIQPTPPDIVSSFVLLFIAWVILQPYPVILTSLVYEKQENLRIMMKMHGLGDGPYWLISYIYFLFVSLAYMLCFVVSSSIIGLRMFRGHDYSLQFAFYFVYLNLQIAFGFLVSGIFSKVKTASVVSYTMVFGSGLFGAFFFARKVTEVAFPRFWITIMELYPGLALYRVLLEFSEAIQTNGKKTSGMRWKDLSDISNGMKEVLTIMAVEWFVFLLASSYMDQVVSSGSGVRKSPLFFLWKRKTSPSSLNSSSPREEKADVARERVKVEQLLDEQSTGYAMICDDLKKVYPGVDGNPAKVAVRGLSLALPHGECFGMLGPNGAGKTSFINMMIGLTEPSSGTAHVKGLDIRTDMDTIYTSMGVCPQDDLLWETLTGREHLLFYGRLKNLKGSALKHAVEESLRSVNLFDGGVADKYAGKYSGGMKRRLSVAISLIGDPKVVYMDEPSTGLDPAARNELWEVVMRAKMKTAILLTTHSMEEAEHLCDRLGIFVNGSLQCIANPKQLKARYGGFYVLTITTAPAHEQEVETLVRGLCPNGNKTYHLSGTQKFELPKHEIWIADVFEAIEDAKRKFTVQAWALVDTTLEDVFIKVAREAQAFSDE